LGGLFCFVSVFVFKGKVSKNGMETTESDIPQVVVVVVVVWYTVLNIYTFFLI